MMKNSGRSCPAAIINAIPAPATCPPSASCASASCAPCYGRHARAARSHRDRGPPDHSAEVDDVDLRLATIYVMPLGGDTDAVLAALERNKFLRGEIAHRVNLKFAPEIRFRIDERFDEAERIEKLLRTPAVRRDLDNKTDDET